MEYLVARDVTPQECPWLKQTIKQGSIVLAFHGNTYGCIGTGVAVTESGGSAPFFEIPRDAIEEKKHVPQPYLGIPQWIPVSERLPEPGMPVIAFVESCYGVVGSSRRLRAQHAPPKTLGLSPEAEGGIYDEETDTFYCEEGWYETNEFEEVHWNVDGVVTHWMPLPNPPASVGAASI